MICTKKFQFNEQLSDIEAEIEAIRMSCSTRCLIGICLESLSALNMVKLAFAIAAREEPVALEIKYPFKSESQWREEDEKLALLFTTLHERSFSNVSSLKIKGCIGQLVQKDLGKFLQACGGKLCRLEYAGNENFQHLKDCTSLAVKALYINGNNLQLQRRPQLDKGNMLLLTPLFTSKRLRTLQMLRCHHGAIPALADMLREQTSLTKLHVCMLETHFTESTYLFNSITHLTNLQELRIDGSTAPLGLEGNLNSSLLRKQNRQLLLRHLAELVSTSLPSLFSFGYNPLSTFEPFDITELTPIFHTVKRVCLFFVNIQKNGYPKTMWESALTNNKSLIALDVQTLRVSEGEDFSLALLDFLPRCTTIKSIRLPVREVSPELSQRILKAASQTHSLQHIETASFKGYLGQSHQIIKHQLDKNLLLQSRFLASAPISVYPEALWALAKNGNIGTAFMLIQEHCGILVQGAN